MPQKLKKKDKSNEEDEVEFELGETFDVESEEDQFDDFDLDVDAAEYRGKKGQAGTRSKD